MINPTDNELNEVLARVAGADRVEKRQILFTDYIVMEKEVDCYVTKGGQYICDVESWAPLHDANQMERVEEWLEKHKPQRFTWTMKFINSGISEPRYGVMLERFDDELCEHKNWYAENTDKKRAFALAVWAWWNEQKKEKAT